VTVAGGEVVGEESEMVSREIPAGEKSEMSEMMGDSLKVGRIKLANIPYKELQQEFLLRTRPSHDH